MKKLLKITETPFEKDAEIKEKSDLTNISKLRRRRFKTVYKILPEFSTIWLKKLINGHNAHYRARGIPVRWLRF